MKFMVLVLAVGLLMVGCKKSDDLSQLKDGSKLQQDCARLLADLPQGRVPASVWPRSIRDLNPTEVIRQENNIRILIQHSDRKYTLGYDVFADTTKAPSTQGVWVQKTKTKGVWIFKTQY